MIQQIVKQNRKTVEIKKLSEHWEKIRNQNTKKQFYYNKLIKIGRNDFNNLHFC